MDRELKNQQRIKSSQGQPANFTERESDSAAGRKPRQLQERAKRCDLSNIVGDDVGGGAVNEEKNCSQTLKTEFSICFTVVSQHSSRGNVAIPGKNLPLTGLYNSASGTEKSVLKAQNDNLENEDWTLKWFYWFVPQRTNNVFFNL